MAKKPVSGLRKASRKKAKIKILISGPSGYGKTYSALQMARGMCDSWDEIAIVDTENGSADLYENLGSYSVYTLSPPFHPLKYCRAIKECQAAGIKVLIIDSASHEWNGEGGCLDIHNGLGGGFQSWAEVTPLHNKFVNAVLQCDMHVIMTVRSKTEYEMVKSGDKTTVRKLGMGMETRKGLDFEVTLAFDLINESHYASATKDRTELFDGQPSSVIDQEIGQKIREWAESGTDASELRTPMSTEKQTREAASLIALLGFNKIQTRNALTLFGIESLVPGQETEETIEMLLEDLREKNADLESKASSIKKMEKELPPESPIDDLFEKARGLGMKNKIDGNKMAKLCEAAGMDGIAGLVDRTATESQLNDLIKLIEAKPKAKVDSKPAEKTKAKTKPAAKSDTKNGLAISKFLKDAKKTRITAERVKRLLDNKVMTLEEMRKKIPVVENFVHLVEETKTPGPAIVKWIKQFKVSDLFAVPSHEITKFNKSMETAKESFADSN